MDEEAPIVVEKKDRLAAARVAARERLQKDLARVRELAHEYKHARNSTMLIAEKMGVTLDTARNWRRLAGVSLRRGDGAMLSKDETDAQHRPCDVEPEKPIFLRKWNILDLFDRLMAVFSQVDASLADEDDDEPVDEGDLRRTWVAWRVFLAAAFGVPQSELTYDHSKKPEAPDYLLPTYPGIEAGLQVPRGAAEVPAGATVQEIFERCTKRQAWPEVQSKIVSLIVGRRGGKSYVTAAIGIFLACCRHYKLNLGTKGMVMIIARDRQQAGVIRNYILAFLRECEALAEVLADQPTQNLIELKNGITIEIRAVGDAGTRGYTVVACLCDEIAFWPTEEESVKQDKKVLRALRPSMLTVKGAMLVLLSSPYATRGELYAYFTIWFGKETYTTRDGEERPSRMLVWNADTLSMRPTSEPEVIDEINSEYSDDPESASAEYGGLFRSDLESIFGVTAVEACCVPGRVEQGYKRNVRYRAFVDPSGGSSDSYVVAIAHDEWRGVPGALYRVPVLDKLVEWKAKFDPSVVSLEAILVLKSFHISSVTGDAYAGEWPREPLKKAGIKYNLSEKNRSELYLDLVPMVNAQRCELLDSDVHKRLVSQLVNLERRVGRSGRDSVDHPPGSHDDVANAVAGVLVTEGTGRRVRSTW